MKNRLNHREAMRALLDGKILLNKEELYKLSDEGVLLWLCKEDGEWGTAEGPNLNYALYIYEPPKEKKTVTLTRFLYEDEAVYGNNQHMYLKYTEWSTLPWHAYGFVDEALKKTETKEVTYEVEE